jgi:subtilisin-like proprotein convertase family protein
LQHPAVGNLRVTLIAPDGREFLLADHRGGSGDNFVRTIFSDDAAIAIGDPAAAAPFRGDYRPEQALTPLIGTLVTGTWKLRVEDTGAGDLGELLSWGLYVVPQ